MKSSPARLFVIPLLGALGACGTTVDLRNPQTGATATCESKPLSIASQQVRQGLLTECVDGYTQQGYEVVQKSN